MNLFTNPSLFEFRKLFTKAGNSHAVHHVVVDFDGEVLIDPHLEQPNLDLRKFMVHVQLRSLKSMRDLFQYLVNAWNGIDDGHPFQLPSRLLFRSQML